MSGGPISAAETVIPDSIRAALDRAGWPIEAWIWEQAMLIGLTAAAERDPQAACRRFAAAQDLANTALPADDLRRVTAAANRAMLLGDREQLSAQSARWTGGEGWLAHLRPHARARSSTFHVRLERKHPGGYDRLHAQRLLRLWEEGAARLRMPSDPAAGAAAALVRWRRAAARLGFVDQRKLTAASALLIGHTSQSLR